MGYDEARALEIRRRFEAAGQGHVFRFWEELSEAERSDFIAQLAAIDLELVARLARGEGVAPPRKPDPSRRPAPVLERDRDPPGATRAEAIAHGEDLLSAGRVGAILVAGGQGSRLGFPGPKGCLPVGPLSGATLFEIHAGKIRRLSERYRAPVPWFIMTSPVNDADTRAFFEQRDFFGLSREDVVFFCQGVVPALDDAGRLLLEAKNRVFVSPNGHGGVYEAFAEEGALKEARERGLRAFFYFQVDNPLVRICDPFFLGCHDLLRCDMSLKVLEKTGPGEKIGVVVIEGDRPYVIEYSDLAPEEAERRDARGRLIYWAGSIAIHAFDAGFFARVAEGGIELPYHRARKKIRCLDNRGEPHEIEGTKFERFVFDALPFAERWLHVETVREREFAPIKNARGVDSIESAVELLIAEHRRWLRRAAGIEVEGRVEAAPGTALDWRELVEPLAPHRGKRFRGDILVERDPEGRVVLREVEGG